MEDDVGQTDKATPPEIAFDYIKGAFFRVIHADGITGGITPSGHIHMAFFSERGPIPQREVWTINPDGSPGTRLPEKLVVRPAIVREMDIDVVMPLPVAEGLIVWLQQVVSELKRTLETRRHP